MDTDFRPAPIDLGILLGLAFEGFVDRLHEDLARRGFDDVKRSYGYVFRALADGTASIADLAAHLGVTSQAATRLINEMEAAGYVVRLADGGDRRITRVALARRGEGALAAARRFHGRFERDLAARHGEVATRTLRELLEGMVATGPATSAEGRRLRPF